MLLQKRWTAPSGLECMVGLNDDLGIHCGYVRLPEDHMFHGWDYMDIPWALVADVHGDLTFAGIPRVLGVNEGWWLGFDCAHSGDYIPAFEQMKQEDPEAWARVRALADQIVAPFKAMLDPLGLNQVPDIPGYEDEVLDNDVLGFWTLQEACDETEKLALMLAIGPEDDGV